jgi:hypothetical protein
MTLAELQRALTSVQPAAVLVPPRVMEHVVRQALELSPMTWTVPHASSWIAEKTVLWRYLDHGDLPLAPEQLLPTPLLLLAWPDEDHLLRTPPAAVFLQTWRQLFHVSVHQALDQLWNDGVLTPARLRDRIDSIGPTAFEEIRGVLVAENLLVWKADDRAAFDEFAAFFLELRHFAPGLVSTYFPGLGEPAHVQTLLDKLVASPDILAKTRLEGAPDPLATAPRRSEANEYFHELEVSAQDAERRGNLVDAAIELQRAVRVAPSDRTAATQMRANALLDKLLQRTTAALELPAGERDGWKRLLPILLDKADQGNRPTEAALLYDLQNICIDHEREIYRLDAFEWLLSAGKRPLRRPLPSQRVVRITRTLRGAMPSLTSARLSDEDRAELEKLLKHSLERGEEAVRDRFRPLLDGAFRDVGLLPRDALETIAFRKMIEELLDRLLDDGFFTFSDLRDTISRNQLKLPDLSDPQDFLRGDALVRLDRRLTSSLDGVYRPADFYLRWLERLTSFNFGTQAGRKLTLLFTVPILGGLLLVGIIDVLGDLVVEHVLPLMRPAAPVPTPIALPADVPPDAATETVLQHAAAAHAEAWMSEPLFWSLFVLFVVTIFGLLHSATLRHRFREGLRAFGRALWLLLIDLPVRALKHDAVERVLTSWPFQLAFSWVILPGVLTLAFTQFIPQFRADWVKRLLVFLAVSCLVNTRPGKAAWETLVGAIYGLFELCRNGLVLGVLRFVLWLFKRISHLFESAFFAIDEWLRFRGGESRWEIAVRTVLTLLWAPISFVIRFLLIVFIEPCFNPVKLPICLIAAKLMVPVWGAILPNLSHWLRPVLGVAFTGLVVTNIVIWGPDAFGFIFWELKENWFLYRANRFRSVEPTGVGPHGETIRGLFQPGIHSGTLPKLFATMRKAELRALRTDNYSPTRAAKAKCRHVEEAIARFVSRECGFLLEMTPAWSGRSLQVGSVDLSSNRIRCRLDPGEAPGSSEPLLLSFDFREGWIVAHLETPSWFAELDRDALSALHNTLVRLYRLAEVDLIVEHLGSLMATPGERFEVKRDGLTLWTPEQPPTDVDLRVRPEHDAPVSTWDPRKILFSRRPLSRDACSSAWPADAKEAVPLLLGDVHVFRWPTPSRNGVVPSAESNGEHSTIVVPAAR